MTEPRKITHAPGYVPNPRYSQQDWDEVSDNPELTAEQLANARPFAEVFPDLARRGRQKAPTKVATSIRLDRDVLAALKSTGPGWQSRVNELLRKALRRPRAPTRTGRTVGKRSKSA